MSTEILDFVKALSDPERLRIIGALSRGPQTAAQVASTSGLPLREAFNHLAFLEHTKVVQARAAEKKQDEVYELDAVFLEQLARQQFEGTRPGYTPASEAEEEARRTLTKFLNPNGSIRQIPNSRTPGFRIILGYVLNTFEVGKTYTEMEVNGILKRFNEDISGLRRDLVDAGMLQRERDGSRYWRPKE